MARAVLLIQKSIPAEVRKQIIETFSRVDDFKSFRYVVIAYIAHFYYRKNKKLRLIPLSVSLAAALFKKKPIEAEDEDFEAIPLT